MSLKRTKEVRLGTDENKFVEKKVSSDIDWHESIYFRYLFLSIASTPGKKYVLFYRLRSSGNFWVSAPVKFLYKIRNNERFWVENSQTSRMIMITLVSFMKEMNKRKLCHESKHISQENKSSYQIDKAWFQLQNFYSNYHENKTLFVLEV